MKIVMLVLNDMSADARVDREALALAEAGHEVTVLALRSGDLPERERRRGYTVLRVADYTTASWRDPFAKLRQNQARRRALLEAGLEEQPEVVHAHDTDTLAVGALLADLAHVPLVYDAHELYPDMIAEFGRGGSWPVQTYWKRIERANVPRAGLVITVSGGLADELRKRFGADPVVVRNVPALEPLADRARLRDELGMVGDPRPLFVYQGVLIPGRGLVRLVEAVGQVSDLVLAIQGFGPEETAMRARAEQLGLADRVRFMGRQPPSELHAYACGADAGVVIYERTTLNNYLAGPNKLYAYLMAGLPIAASAFPGLAEVVVDQDVGVTFDPASVDSITSALRELAGDPVKRERMGGRARVLAETRYNWDAEKRVLVEAYEQLSASRHAGP